MNLQSHDFRRFKDMGLLKYYNLNLIDKQKDSNRPYRSQKSTNSENFAALKNDYVKLLEQQKLDLEQKDLELQQLRQDNEKLKNQVDKLEKDNDTINKAYQKFKEIEVKRKINVKRAAAVKKRKILAIKLNRKKKVFEKEEDPVEIIKTPRLSKINAINSITTHNQPAPNAVIEDNKKNKPVNNNEDVSIGSSSTSENIIIVPSYREKVFTPLYRIEGTENITDEIYLKRHQKHENEEKQIKKWDMRRQREDFERMKLLQRQRKKSTSATVQTNDQVDDKPNIYEIETIEIVSEESELNEATPIAFESTKKPNLMSVYDDIDMDYSARADQSSIIHPPPPRKRSRIR